MKAHFAAADEVVSTTTHSVDTIEEEPLKTRIDEFKQDSQNMNALTEFIDDVLQTAETEAVKQQNAKTDKKVVSSILFFLKNFDHNTNELS